jgi:hypothetical protein
MLGCFHITPNHNQITAVNVPIYLLSGTMSWLVKYTVNNAKKVPLHFT